MMSTERNRRRVLVFSLLAFTGLMACEDDPMPPPDPEPGVISGTVTVDNVGVAGIAVDLTGLASASATSDASGGFSFPNLQPGDYTVTISGTDTDLVTFDMTSVPVTLASAGAETVTFTGTPTGVQRVMIYAYYGIEGSKPNVAPAPGFQVSIYRTEFDRDTQNNPLRSVTTDAAGLAMFEFNRSDDTDNGGGATDNTVYSRVTNTPGPRQIGQTDMLQTIAWAGHEVVAMAPDTIDMLNSEVTATLRIQTIQTSYTGPEGSALFKPEWTVRTRTDTAAAGGIASDETGFDGVASFELFTDIGNLPITVHFRADESQPSDAGNIWTQTPEPTSVAAGTGRYITYVHDGTQPPGTVDLGIQRVEYITQGLFVPVHHEVDDAEATPINTPGGDDDTDGAVDILIELLADDQSTVLRSKNASSNGHVVWSGPRAGGPSADSLNAQDVFYVRASSGNSAIEIVSPTVYRVGEAGGGSVGTFGPGAGGFRHSARVCPLSADTVIANCSAFAYKYNNTPGAGIDHCGRCGRIRHDGRDLRLCAAGQGVLHARRRPVDQRHRRAGTIQRHGAPGGHLRGRADSGLSRHGTHQRDSRRRYSDRSHQG